MHRRTFLARCGLAATGATFGRLLIPGGPDLRAAVTTAAQPTAQLTGTDQALLGVLTAYGTDTYFWGGQVFSRATGIGPQDGTTRLLVQVPDYDRLAAFLNSDALKALGIVYAVDNTLSFTYQGTAYAVTNLSPEEFATAASGAGVASVATDDGGAAVFTHDALLYHPSTNTLSDPGLVVADHHTDFFTTPGGGVPARFETLLQGLVSSRQYGMKLGRKFKAFEAELLATQPGRKAAKKVVRTLLEKISLLASLYDVEGLRPLLTSPLVSASLQGALGLDANAVLARVEKLRAKAANGDDTDAALWLVALLRTQIKAGTAGEWLDEVSGDQPTDLATRAAFATARQILGATDSGAA